MICKINVLGGDPAALVFTLNTCVPHIHVLPLEEGPNGGVHRHDGTNLEKHSTVRDLKERPSTRTSCPVQRLVSHRPSGSRRPFIPDYTARRGQDISIIAVNVARGAIPSTRSNGCCFFQLSKSGDG